MLFLYKTYVRSNLEYCCPLWNPSGPNSVASIKLLESVQRTFTSKISSMTEFNYWERLEALNLMSLVTSKTERAIYCNIYVEGHDIQSSKRFANYILCQWKISNQSNCSWHTRTQIKYLTLWQVFLCSWAKTVEYFTKRVYTHHAFTGQIQAASWSLPFRISRSSSNRWLFLTKFQFITWLVSFKNRVKYMVL